MSRKQKFKPAVAVANRADDPYITSGAGSVQSDKFWRWGDDNLFPNALALMARRSVTHRRIINDKADYISGKGFSCDEGHEPLLAAFIRRVNGDGESLRQVLNKLAFDKALFGNAFLEIVTDAEHSFLAFHHQDASRCRVARDSAHILLHHDWAAFNATEARTLPLYPAFERQEDSTLRAMIHYKDYEPMFEHYGVPPYIAGFNVSAIAYKTDRWNISRLDNSFQLSGVMMLDSTMDDEAQAERIMRTAEEKFAGNPGQVMFVLREGAAEDHSRFIPIASQNEGDWRSRTGHFGHRGRPFVVPDPERTGLRLGLQRRTHPARIRNRPQHGHPGRTGRAAGADPRNHRTHPRRRPLVARNRQSSADPLQTPLYESLGGPQSRRPGLRPRRRTPATFPGRNHQV